jgi:hypothetical protein
MDRKAAQTPIEDYRKSAIALILVPYLCNVKKMPVDEAYRIVIEWLECCNTLRRLDFRPKQRVTDAIKVAIEKKIPPMRVETLKSRAPALYDKLFRNKSQMN